MRLPPSILERVRCSTTNTYFAWLLFNIPCLLYSSGLGLLLDAGFVEIVLWHVVVRYLVLSRGSWEGGPASTFQSPHVHAPEAPVLILARLVRGTKTFDEDSGSAVCVIPCSAGLNAAA